MRYCTRELCGMERRLLRPGDSYVVRATRHTLIRGVAEYDVTQGVFKRRLRGLVSTLANELHWIHALALFQDLKMQVRSRCSARLTH